MLILQDIFSYNLICKILTTIVITISQVYHLPWRSVMHYDSQADQCHID